MIRIDETQLSIILRLSTPSQVKTTQALHMDEVLPELMFAYQGQRENNGFPTTYSLVHYT